MKYLKVVIGGVDVTEFVISGVMTTTYGDAISTYDLVTSSNVNSAIAITNALTVVVYADTSNPPTTPIFNGFINSYKPEPGKIAFECKDQLNKLISTQVDHYYNSSDVADPAYPSGKISTIFNDIVTTYAGLDTNGGATVQDSGTAIVITKFDCRNADPMERCKKLAEALGWIFYYRADTGYVYFEPKNFTTNSTILTVGGNVVKIPNWESNRDEMINDLTINGASQLVQESEKFSGNAVTVTFTLAYTPSDVAVYYSAAKNYATTSILQPELKIGDITNSIATHDYEVDTKNKTITFTSFVPASATNNIQVNYSRDVPIPVHLVDDASKTTYGAYIKDVTLTDVLNYEDAWKRGQNLLAKYSKPFLSAKIRYLYLGATEPTVGQQIRVVDSIIIPNVDNFFTIYKHIDYWPEQYNEIELGDKQFSIEEYQANLVERVKRLEDSTTTRTDNLTEIVQTDITFDVVPDTTVIDIEMINDSFCLDHPINGVLYVSPSVELLSNCNTATGWGGSNVTCTNDSTAGHFVEGTQGVKCSWTGAVTASPSRTITSTDLSTITGVTTGTPVSGTIGIWIYVDDATKLDVITKQYFVVAGGVNTSKTYNMQTYKYRNGLSTTNVLENGLNYMLVDLNSPITSQGDLNWTTVTDIFVIFTTLATSFATIDYITASISNDIGLNGLGDRSTTLSSTTYTW